MCSVVAGGRLQLGGQWWFFQSVEKQHRVVNKVSLLATKQSSLERALYTHTFYSLTSLTPHYPIPFCRYVFKNTLNCLPTVPLENAAASSAASSASAGLQSELQAGQLDGALPPVEETQAVANAQQVRSQAGSDADRVGLR